MDGDEEQGNGPVYHVYPILLMAKMEETAVTLQYSVRQQPEWEKLSQETSRDRAAWDTQMQKKDIIRMDCKETDEDSSENVCGFYESQELTGLLLAYKELGPMEQGYVSYF